MASGLRSDGVAAHGVSTLGESVCRVVKDVALSALRSKLCQAPAGRATTRRHVQIPAVICSQTVEFHPCNFCFLSRFFANLRFSHVLLCLSFQDWKSLTHSDLFLDCGQTMPNWSHVQIAAAVVSHPAAGHRHGRRGGRGIQVRHVASTQITTPVYNTKHHCWQLNKGTTKRSTS